jgi:uncharacterized protein (TIGR02453 family)
MTTGFSGFPPEALQFFRGLRRRNNREWFLPRKELFLEKVRMPMEGLVSAVNGKLIRFAPAYVTDPDKAIYRFYRDTRFSPDKTPYKDHIAAIFVRRGLRKHQSAGFYFSISDREIEVAGGLYLPGPDELRLVRNHLRLHHREFRRLIASRRLRGLMGEFQGDRLSRVPRGFCSEDEAADLLVYKQFLFFAVLDPCLALAPSCADEIAGRFRAIAPFVEFLNRPLVEQKGQREFSEVVRR